MEIVSTPFAPPARGHYSQAVVHAGLVFVAGQLPVVPAEPDRRLGTFEEQAHQVITNVLEIVEAAGSAPEPAAPGPWG